MSETEWTTISIPKQEVQEIKAHKPDGMTLHSFLLRAAETYGEDMVGAEAIKSIREMQETVENLPEETTEEVLHRTRNMPGIYQSRHGPKGPG